MDADARRALAAACDDNEAAAMSDLFAAAPAATRRVLGLEVRPVLGGTALLAPATGTAFFNRVIGLGVHATVTRSQVEALVERHRHADRPLMIHVNPCCAPPELPTWLTDAGLAHRSTWAVKYRDVPQAVPAVEHDLSVVEVDDRLRSVFAETFCTGYGMPDEWSPLFTGIVGRPGWRNYLAFSGKEPISTASSFRHGRTVWLGNAATLPAHRGRRAHLVLLGRRINDALGTGATLFTGETWHAGPRQYNSAHAGHSRVGLAVAYDRLNFQ